MGDKTSISWTDATWNPIRGCSRVSEGCRNCYAERVAARFCGPGEPYEGIARRRAGGPQWTGDVRVISEHLGDPLRWRKPRRVFVNSMSDLFHENLTNEEIAAVFGVMAAAPQHTFQVLTKRARRMREWFEWIEEDHRGDELNGDRIDSLATWAADELGDGSEGDQERWFERVRGLIQDAHDGFHHDVPWPLPNVWIGVSVENQAAADERIPDLLATPAAVRFLSCEPLIGPLDLAAVRGGRAVSSLDWVIAGCESGPGARTCEASWLRSLRDQCEAAGVPFFLKQAVGQARDATQRITVDGLVPVVDAGPGSKVKAGGVIELPYLDGVQHAAFPGGDDAR